MSLIIQNTLRSALAASILITGFAAAADAAELRKSGPRPKIVDTGKPKATQSPSNKDLLRKGLSKEKPDLVVVPKYNGKSGGQNSGFCGLWGGGNPSLEFYVKNTGGKISPASKVSVAIIGHELVTKSVPALSVGQQFAVNYSVPASSVTMTTNGLPSYEFLANADSSNWVSEENNNNNHQYGTCVGPSPS